MKSVLCHCIIFLISNFILVLIHSFYFFFWTLPVASCHSDGYCWCFSHLWPSIFANLRIFFTFQFKSKGGSQVKEYCTSLTKEDCRRQIGSYIACEKVTWLSVLLVAFQYSRQPPLLIFCILHAPQQLPFRFLGVLHCHLQIDLQCNFFFILNNVMHDVSSGFHVLIEMLLHGINTATHDFESQKLSLIQLGICSWQAIEQQLLSFWCFISVTIFWHEHT